MRTELERALFEVGISCSPPSLDQLTEYYSLLIEWNKRTNLTALTDPGDYVYKHVLDSLYPYRFINGQSNLVDIGTGAGFPGLPLKIVWPDLSLTLVEASAKKVAFLEHCCAALKVDAEVIQTRAEELGQGPKRETFSLATTRAVAVMAVISEYCLPLLAQGGLLLALKGPSGEEETINAREAIAELGGCILDIHHYRLPKGDQRTLIVLEKIRPTPAKYPRRPGVPAKKPLYLPASAGNV